MSRKKIKCVVAAFIHQEGRVLVAKRARTKKIAPGKCHLPGGHVMFAEDARDALAREIKEEFNLEIEVGDPLDVFSYTTPGCSHTIGIVFFAQVRGDWHVVSTDASDNEWVDWLPLEEAGRVLKGFGDHNFDALLKGFERLRCGCALPKPSRQAAAADRKKPHRPAQPPRLATKGRVPSA